MPRTRPPYAPEFRRRMVELVRAGRTPEELAQKFEPSAGAIRNWVLQADRDEGKRQDGLTTEERDEVRRLRREVKVLREKREILRKAAAWVSRRTDGGAVGDPLTTQRFQGRKSRRYAGTTVDWALASSTR